MKKSLRIDIKVTDGNGGYTFAGATHTLQKEGASYSDLINMIDGPLGYQLDLAVDHTKSLLRRATRVPLPDMLDHPLSSDQ